MTKNCDKLFGHVYSHKAAQKRREKKRTDR